MHAARHAAATDAVSSDLGRLLLRCGIGLLVLLHGVAKLSNGVDPVMGMLRAQNLPGAVAYLVYVGEVLAPLLLLAGVWTRAAAATVAVNMLVAVALAHQADVAKLNNTGGWAIELQALYLLGALAIVLLGAGRYSVGGVHGR